MMTFNTSSLQKAPFVILGVRMQSAVVLFLIAPQGDQLWRLDGDMLMEPGYPKPLASEFPGLTGSISAALTVPAAGSRPETVYFFKNGEEDSKLIN